MIKRLGITEAELLELVKNKQIPFDIKDKGTVWEQITFIEEDVVKAVKALREYSKKKADEDPFEKPTAKSKK
jgi:organic radical activating enzyme